MTQIDMMPMLPCFLILVPPSSLTIIPSEGTSVDIFQDVLTAFTCTSLESRPQADIRWELGSEPYPSSRSRTKVSEEDNALIDVISTFALQPTRDHHRNLLECHSAVGTIVNKTQITLLVVGKYNFKYIRFV